MRVKANKFMGFNPSSRWVSILSSLHFHFNFSLVLDGFQFSLSVSLWEFSPPFL